MKNYVALRERIYTSHNLIFFPRETMRTLFHPKNRYLFRLPLSSGHVSFNHFVKTLTCLVGLSNAQAISYHHMIRYRSFYISNINSNSTIKIQKIHQSLRIFVLSTIFQSDLQIHKYIIHMDISKT